ncbi:MAG: hypothetical protein K8W52_28345 [Deltaproteobacteria bacterium]|nr:hypothetical protein [Deltaproteobacteria bacterium]
MSASLSGFRTIGRAALIVVAALAAGCGAYTSYKQTRLTPRGHTDYLFAAELQGASTGMDGAPMPEIAVGARRRVHDRIDVGATGTILPLGEAITSASAEVSGKLALGRHGRWSAALGTGVGYRVTTSSGAVFEGVHAAVPVILGVDLGRHQLVLSPTVGYERLWSSGARPVSLPFAGYSLGFRWQLARRWALLPEATVGYTPARNYRTDSSQLFQVGLAVLFTR